MKYDVIIIGAGPSGIFCAYELIRQKPDMKILMLEKGRAIEKRNCPKRKTKKCVGCVPCSITTGFAGAGAFSDGKLSLSPDVGGNLPEILGYEQTEKLLHEADRIYLDFGADEKVYGIDDYESIERIRAKAIRANLKLIECPIRHLGTEEGYKIYTRIQEHLIASGVNIRFMTMVKDILIEDGRAVGVITDQGESLYADEIVAGVGREGSEWLAGICKAHGIETRVGTVDVGVRVEVRDEIMKELNEKLYEAKLVYYTPTFDDKVRVFCTNPSGEVATEYYEGGLAVVDLKKFVFSISGIILNIKIGKSRIVKILQEIFHLIHEGIIGLGNNDRVISKAQRRMLLQKHMAQAHHFHFVVLIRIAGEHAHILIISRDHVLDDELIRIPGGIDVLNGLFHFLKGI